MSVEFWAEQRFAVKHFISLNFSLFFSLRVSQSVPIDQFEFDITVSQLPKIPVKDNERHVTELRVNTPCDIFQHTDSSWKATVLSPLIFCVWAAFATFCDFWMCLQFHVTKYLKTSVKISVSVLDVLTLMTFVFPRCKQQKLSIDA